AFRFLCARKLTCRRAYRVQPSGCSLADGHDRPPRRYCEQHRGWAAWSDRCHHDRNPAIVARQQPNNYGELSPCSLGMNLSYYPGLRNRPEHDDVVVLVRFADGIVLVDHSDHEETRGARPWIQCCAEPN